MSPFTEREETRTRSGEKDWEEYLSTGGAWRVYKSQSRDRRCLGLRNVALRRHVSQEGSN